MHHFSLSESVKEETLDDDFSEKKKGLKRKRVKDKPMDSTTIPT